GGGRAGRDQPVEIVWDSGAQTGPFRSTEFAPAMADDAPFLPGLSPVAGKPVQITCRAGRPTSDGGVLLLADIERTLAIAESRARCAADPRAPERVQHGLAE